MSYVDDAGRVADPDHRQIRPCSSARPVCRVGRHARQPTGPRDDVTALRATGTDDSVANPSEKRQQIRQQSERDMVHSDATRCDTRDVKSAVQTSTDDNPKPLQRAELRDAARRGATRNDNGPAGIRTRTPVYEKRILSPLRLPIPPRGLNHENLTAFR